MMNAIQQELFDTALLRVLDANRTRYGLNAGSLALLISQFGFNTDADTVMDRIDYLTGKGLAEEVEKSTHKANRAWRITEAGINHLDR